MTRRRASSKLAAGPGSLVTGNVAWCLKALADGGTLVGVPKGVNPRGATPWEFTVTSRDGRDRSGIPHSTVTALTHAGLLSGRAGAANGGPMMTFTLTDRGLAELARHEGGLPR